MTTAGEGISEKSIVMFAQNIPHVVSQADRNCSFIPTDQLQKIFFPGAGDHVDFTAYYPYSKDVELNIYPIDLSDQSNIEAIDLMTAKVADKSSANPNVALEFRHRLAKLDISIRENNALTEDIIGGTVKIEGLHSKGSFDLNTDLVAPQQESEKVINTTINQYGYATVLVMPFAKGQNSDVSITITTKSGVSRKYQLPYSSLLEGVQHPLLYDIQNFSDEKFRAYLVSALGLIEKDGDIDPTDPANKSKIEATTSLQCNGLGIKNIQGIENFTNLTSLNCSNNLIETLDLSTMPGLTSLNCSKNKLALLDISEQLGLTSLDCSNNVIKVLEISNHNSMNTLRCSSNDLYELVLPSNGALERLYCNENQIATLEIPEGLALTYLACDYNNLQKIDISKTNTLFTLQCSRNPITVLDLKANTNLENLYCYGCKLESLDLTANTKLVTIHSYENQMTELDITVLPSIQSVWCGNQKQTGLVLKLTQEQFDGMWQKESNKDYYDNLDVEAEVI